jgi:tRNA pseudouridine55 synthase
MDGVLNLDKPAGWTSHDVVARVRRLTGIRRVGHTGTLDPMATGVLVVCLGQATRLIEYLAGEPKTYEARIQLGTATDTYDAEGQITGQAAVPPLHRASLDRLLDRFRGDIMQTPPVYSALKQDGVALHRRARRGETVQVAPRPVSIYELKLLAFDGQAVQVRVVCSAGTYIRSLAHDLGRALGCGGHLSSLRRTAVGRFAVERAATLEQLAAAGGENRWSTLLLPADTLAAHLPAVSLSEDEATRLRYGQAIPAASPGQGEGPVRAYDDAGRLVAMVRFDATAQAWRPLKVLAWAH